MRFIKPLVLITCFLLIAIVVFYYHLFLKQPLEPIPMTTQNNPTIGYQKAQVHVVVFEEPKCKNCKVFNNEIFPTIKKQFIDTNKILYTTIPVSFLPDSMPMAVGALCAYYADPQYPNYEMFGKYCNYIYSFESDHEEGLMNLDTLTEFSKTLSLGMDISQLKECIQTQKYRVQIEKNTDYGIEIMNGMISTPTVYVNGIEVKERTIEGISKLIQTYLQEE
ncbi:MAG: thioredoxin domain-containing protein [Chlamydiales bacterium]